jgi:LysM repeat protein
LILKQATYSHSRYNPRAVKKLTVFVVSLSLATTLTACVERDARIEPSATVTLFPFHTATALPTIESAAAIESVDITPEPSATPLTHIIQEGDTLLGIAIQYGLELDDILVTNPGLNPRFLTVGDSLIIPSAEGGTEGAILPTATALPIRIVDVRCFSGLDGGQWCLTHAEYPGGETIENISVRIEQVDRNGDVVNSGIAYAPLNLLPPGEIAPLAVYFDPPIPEYQSITTEVLGAVFNTDIGERYAGLQVEVLSSNPASDRLSWTVDGEVRISSLTQGQKYRLGVLVLALDERDQVLGFTKWEPDQDGLSLAVIPFEAVVFSLGSEIDEVRVYAEALLTP